MRRMMWTLHWEALEYKTNESGSITALEPVQDVQNLVKFKMIVLYTWFYINLF